MNPSRLFFRILPLFLLLLLAGPCLVVAQADDLETAEALEQKVENLYREGRYTEAIPIAKQVVDIREKALGPDHPDVASGLNNLATLYKSSGDYAKAEPLHQRSLSIREKAFGPDHPDVAQSLNNLAALCFSLGDYAKAEALYQSALANWEKVLGPDHPDVALGLNNLAMLHESLGDYAKAVALYQRALEIFEKTFGPNHSSLAIIINNIANLCDNKVDHAKTESLYQRSLAINEKAFGPDHPSVALSLNNLALLYQDIGDYAKAEPLYQRSLAIWEKALGPDHPDVATSLNNLATLYADSGDNSKAEQLCRRALSISEKALGPEHPDVAQSLNNLASLFTTRCDFLRAHDLLIASQLIDKKIIDAVIGFTSENKKLIFLFARSGELNAFLSHAGQYMAHVSEARKDAFNVWLGRKGVILEAQRRFQEAIYYSDDPQAKQVMQDLAGVRSQLSKLVFGGPGKEGPEAYKERIATLEKKKEALEVQLSRLSQGFATRQKITRADADAVAKALPAGSVLIDFARIEDFNFKARGQEEKWGPARYLVFVLAAGSAGQVELVNLGEAAAIEKAIEAFKRAMADPKAAGKASEAARRLYDLAFAPLKPAIGGAKQIFISPDGALSLIPFEVLQAPDGRYLIEDYTFNYLAAGRDVVGFGQEKKKTGPCLLMGDPAFDLEGKEKQTALTRLGLHAKADDPPLVAMRSRDMRGFAFAPLPGTRKEIQAIAKILGSGKAEVFTGTQALAEVLAARPSPRILHLATHGFFLEDQDIKAFADPMERGLTTVKALPVGKFDNPLRRSGLALAGANRSLQDQDNGASDGLLTAEKVLGLRLDGTELVVLSACQTGLGQIQTGEGVYGLRRAFVQAGTKGLVMSMWPVPDHETQELMTLFYRNLTDGRMNRGQALRAAALVQMAAVKQRHGTANPFYWGAFVYLGEP